MTFEEHCAREHNLWNYLYFIVHLRTKDPTEYTGPESFVSSLLDSGDLEWFPRLKVKRNRAAEDGEWVRAGGRSRPRARGCGNLGPGCEKRRAGVLGWAVGIGSGPLARPKGRVSGWAVGIGYPTWVAY